MKNIKRVCMIFVILMMVGIIGMQVSSFAANETSTSIVTITSNKNNVANNTATITATNVVTNTTKNTVTNNVNTTSNKVNTTANKTNSTKLPYTGSNTTNVLIISVIFIISAVYAYKKVSDYNM